MDIIGPIPSWKGVYILTAQILNEETTTKIDRTQQVVNEMKRYKTDILGISEIRWTGNGRTTSRETTILFSGNQNLRNRGVGILWHDITAKAFFGWKPVNDKIITAHLLTWHAKVTVIQGYAATVVLTDHKKLKFYNHLQETFDEIPCHVIKLLNSDFNARIDRNREGQDCTIGPHGSGNTATDNGKFLTQFCTFNRSCIENSYFKHKTLTW